MTQPSPDRPIPTSFWQARDLGWQDRQNFGDAPFGGYNPYPENSRLWQEYDDGWDASDTDIQKCEGTYDYE